MRAPARNVVRSTVLVLVTTLAFFAVSAPARVSDAAASPRLLEDLSRRAFLFFWQQADPNTGLILDRARNDGKPETRRVASAAATGFGLTALCIGAERGWQPRDSIRARVAVNLRYYARRAPNEHGWFYHFIDARTGERVWNSEISSIDTALLLAGVLTARQYFHDDREIVRLATGIYRRVDFKWMLNGDPFLLSHGWYPERGFIRNRWDSYCELMILYLLAIGSPTHPIPADAWYAWRRPVITYKQYTYLTGGPLFMHQYSHAWVDFRNRREARDGRIDYFANSVTATLANREYCIDLHTKFPGYGPDVWGVTASDSANGYIAWGGPPPDPHIDGTVVPSAAAGSLMFTPELSLRALGKMRCRFARIYGQYGFANAFNPETGWVDPDVIGIDVGITLLSAENLRTGNVWRWFMRNSEIRQALERVQLLPVRSEHAQMVGCAPVEQALRPAFCR